MNLIRLFLFAITISSCNALTKNPYDINKIPKDWFALTEMDKKLVIFYPCNANNISIKISAANNKYFFQWDSGQEQNIFEVLETYQTDNDTVVIKTKLKDSETKEDFKFIWTDKNKKLGKWITTIYLGVPRTFTFVTAGKEGEYPAIEQPCKECWDNEICDDIKRKEEIKNASIKTIRNIFEDYIKYQESSDSKEDKDNMSKSLENLNYVTDYKDLELLLNVWMYYDPTDFPSRNLVDRILKLNKVNSIKAIKTRIDNKKEWEKDDTAPYSELKVLLKKLDIK